MAEVQEPQAAGGAEPSMEEILASIRKIITDENVPAAANGAAAQDVVELTQMVQDDGSVVDVKATVAAPPVPPPSSSPPSSSPPSSSPPSSSPPPSPPPKAAPPAPAVTKPPEKPSAAPAPALVSEPAVSAAATSLSSLASTVEIERLSTAPVTATPFGNGTRTLEDMVIELMRPLLKEWLDKNLPATVDRLVQKEIERISKKAQD